MTVYALSEAVSRTIMLIVIFGGIGVVVNVLIGYILVGVYKEYSENGRRSAPKPRA